jgi:hypothetical protein
MDYEAIREVLASTAEITGVRSVSLKLKMDLLETVYVELIDERILISDGLRTYGYLVSCSDNTYRAWDTAIVQNCCTNFGVELFDESDEDSIGFRIQGFADDPRTLDEVIGAVASAIDAVFHELRAY